MTTTTDEPVAHVLEPDGEPSAKEAYAFLLTLFGVFGAIALVVALVIGPGKDSTTASAGAAPVAVTLTEFAINPATVNAVNGAGIDVTNSGQVQHNLAVDGTELATPMIDPGQSAHL